MATSYAPLMEASEESVIVDLFPEDVIKLIARLRGVGFFMRINVPLVTARHEDGSIMGMDLGGNVSVSAAQVTKLMKDRADTNARRLESGKPMGRIEVTRLGQCLFLG